MPQQVSFSLFFASYALLHHCNSMPFFDVVSMAIALLEENLETDNPNHWLEAFFTARKNTLAFQTVTRCITLGNLNWSVLYKELEAECTLCHGCQGAVLMLGHCPILQVWSVGSFIV